MFCVLVCASSAVWAVCGVVFSPLLSIRMVLGVLCMISGLGPLGGLGLAPGSVVVIVNVL